MKKIIKTYLPIIVFAVLFLVLLLFLNGNKNSHEQRLKAQNAEIVALKNEIDSLSSKLVSETKRVYQKSSGLDLERQKEDDSKASELFEKIFTWKTFNEYNEIKEVMKNDYKIADNVITSLMPNVNMIDVGDKKINEIDAYERNMKYDSLKSYVVGIKGSNYTYLTEVSVTSSDVAGNTASGVILMQYTVDFDGNITNVNAYTLAKK